MDVFRAKRLKQLAEESAKLKKLFLRELLSKNGKARDRKLLVLKRSSRALPTASDFLRRADRRTVASVNFYR
jgi:hypothetical protein